MELMSCLIWFAVGIVCFVLSHLFGAGALKVSDPEIENFHILLSIASFLVGIAAFIVSATYAVKIIFSI